MKNTSVLNFSAARTGCQNCGLANICLPGDKSIHDVIPDDHIIRHNHQFERGEHIFRVNDAFKTVYAIRTGSVKTYTSIENGQEQVTGFHLPGEMLGLASISTNYHMESAIALESSTICEIAFDRLENMSHTSPALQHALLHVMSEEIQDDHRRLTLISRMPADVRLANFLLSISSNFKKRGFSATDFYLSMTRNDIANLLGLAVETISRLFSQFQDKGLLTVERRHVVLHDLNGLMKISSHLTGNHSGRSRYMMQEKAG